MLPLFGGQIENVIHGSPESLVMRKGESPVVKASVEMEEQMVNLEGRSVTRSSDRIAKSLTDSSGPGAGSDGIPVPDPSRTFFQVPDPSRPEN